MTGIFYGSSGGNTRELAHRIAERLNIPTTDIYNVADTPAEAVDKYDTLLLGSSTWGAGDLQDDWYGFLERLRDENIRGKKVAFFGCGDSSLYPDTFCDALGILMESLWETGCTFIGEMRATDYPDTSSKAFAAGRAIGLAADDDEPDKTPERLDAWLVSIRNG